MDKNIMFLKEFLEYDPFTGEFIWLKRSEEFFNCNYDCIKWNRNFEGTIATKTHEKGYLTITLRQKTYFAHRLAWAYVFGDLPKQEIDHINHKRDDNRLENLREVSILENQKNRQKSRANSSGFTGVYYNKTSKQWVAFIGLNKATKNLGSYKDKDAAIVTRKIANIIYGFHENHGL